LSGPPPPGTQQRRTGRRRALAAVGAALGTAAATRLGIPAPALAAAPQTVATSPSPVAATGPTALEHVRPDGGFSFVLLGDTPYSRLEELRLQEVVTQLDADRLAFVLHVGDFKGGREPCSDELLGQRRAIFDASAHPLVLTPGDNDWTDCHRLGAGEFDPLDRLAYLRRHFFAGPTSLGRRSMPLERQQGYPENTRWRIGSVTFVALHVIGSNDGLGEHPGSDVEWRARTEANRRWLEATLDDAAPRADALVIAIHANPGFGTRLRSGHQPFRRMLLAAARRFDGRILFLHGDTHRFRTDRPLYDDAGRHVPNVTRVESFGSPFGSSWVRISYEPGLDERFVVSIRSL
jgi:hypothetical protein